MLIDLDPDLINVVIRAQDRVRDLGDDVDAQAVVIIGDPEATPDVQGQDLSAEIETLIRGEGKIGCSF